MVVPQKTAKCPIVLILLYFMLCTVKPSSSTDTLLLGRVTWTRGILICLDMIKLHKISICDWYEELFVIQEKEISYQSKHNLYSLSETLATCFELIRPIVRSLFNTSSKHNVMTYECRYFPCFICGIRHHNYYYYNEVVIVKDVLLQLKFVLKSVADA
jgi:hypothetical protein